MKKKLLVVTGICAAVGSMIAARHVSYASKDNQEELHVAVLESLEEYETSEEIEPLTETILQSPESDLTENGKTSKNKPKNNKKDEGTSCSTEVQVEQDNPKTKEEKPEDLVTTEATTEQANDSTTKQADEPTTEEVKEDVKVWVPAEYERVWVVDVASWTEEIPIYEEHEAAECVKCHAILYSQAEVEAHGEIPACEPLQYRNYVYTVQTGTMSIFHEEEGHYEQRLVREGHYE